MKTKLKKSDVIKGFTTIYSYAQSMIDKLPEEVEIVEETFVIKTLKDLSFDKWTKTSDFMNNQFLATKGLELCEPISAIDFLKKTLKKDSYIYIAMESISDSDGYPSVFDMGRNGVGLWLNYAWARPAREWRPNHEFVFRLRKSLGSSDSVLNLDDLDTLKLRIEKLEKLFNPELLK